MTGPVPPLGEMSGRRRRQRAAGTGAATGCLVSGGIGAAILLVVLMIGAQTLKGCDIHVGSIDVGPIGAGDGKESQRLDVAVSPTVDLVDGQSVLLTTTALRKSEVVGVTQCLREADTEGQGFDACDRNQVVRYANRRRVFQTGFVVRQVLTVRGEAYDCASAPGRCVVVASSADDFDRSGGRPLTFRPNPVPLVAAPDRPASARLPVTGAPAGPTSDGTPIHLTASGFQPGEPLLYARCTDELDRVGIRDACDPLNPSAALLAIALSSLPDDAPTADADGTIATTIEVRARIRPYLSSTTVDCAGRPGRCSIVIAAAADPHRSAVLPYEVVGG